jgi:hypothetical protein
MAPSGSKVVGPKQRAEMVFSTFAQGPVRLNTEQGAFKSMDLRVFAGDHGCPESDRPRAACDAVVRWNGTAFTYDLIGAPAPAEAAAKTDQSGYELDRAHFASSTDWFMVDNYPTPKKTDPTRSLHFRRFYFPYVDDALREGQLANTITFVCQKRHLNQISLFTCRKTRTSRRSVPASSGSRRQS